MRRASASSLPQVSRLTVLSFLGSVLAVFLTLSASGTSIATEDTDDRDAGRLNLNSDVLVNEAVDTGTVGNFAIRGRLFSPEINTRAEAQQAAAASRLDAVGQLSFTDTRFTGDEYQEVRTALFADYSPEARSGTRDEQVSTQLVFVFTLALGIPLVLGGGAALGRAWAKRKRVQT